MFITEQNSNFNGSINYSNDFFNAMNCQKHYGNGRLAEREYQIERRDFWLMVEGL